MSLELSREAVEELGQFSRQEPGRIAQRAWMMLWLAEGLWATEVAARLSCHERTVSRWRRRYERDGVNGLLDRPRSGRPRKLSAPKEEEVAQTVSHPPPEAEGVLGFWTLPRLCQWVQAHLEVTISRFSIRRLLQRTGFVWKRPRLWAFGEDEEKQEKLWLIEVAKERAREREDVHFLYADASDHHLLALLRAMWMPRGTQVRVQTPPRNGRWSLFGALESTSGRFCWLAFEKAVTANFLLFLEYLLKEYEEGEIVLVVDNASYHTSKAVQEWLKKHPRLLLLYLPTHSPHLNPVEKIWAALKQAVSANRSFASLLVLGVFIRSFFAGLTPAKALRLAALSP